MDKVRLHIVVLLAVIFFLGRQPLDWFGGLSIFCQATLHHFLHANIFHLAANCLAVWTMFGCKWKSAWKEIMCAFVIGTLSFLIASAHSVGFSDILFAVLGIRAARNGWWRSRYFVVMWATLILTALIPGISGLTHALSCAGGTVFGLISAEWKKILDDYGKARGNK